MNIYIKIEIKSRELEARLLLALAAAERGHDVLMGPKSLTVDAAIKGQLKPGIIHDKSISPGKPRIKELKIYKQKGFLCTSIDEEGGEIEKNYKTFAKLRFSNQTLNLTTRIFSWGKFDLQGINDSFPGFSSKLSITGNPRIDLLREDFSEYYSNQNVEGFNNYIMLSSNLCGPLCHNKMWERIANNRKIGYYDLQGNNAEFKAYFHESNTVKLIAYFVNAIKNIASNYPEKQIIIRPHPWEGEEAWAGFLGEISNVHITKKGGFHHWINNAELVIHNGCTTGIEAAISRVPVIAYCPKELPNEYNIPNEVSYKVFEEKQLIKTVGYVLDNKKLPEKFNYDESLKIINNRFDNLTGPLAVDRIVDEWEKLDNGSLSESNNYLKIKLIANIHVLRRFAGRIFYKIISNRKNNLVKIPPIKKSELFSIIDRYKRTLDRFHNLNIKLIGDRHVLIRGKKL